MDEGQSPVGLGGVKTKGSSLVGHSDGVQEVNRQVAKRRGQDLWCRFTADPASILPKGYITRPKWVVLNPPMRPA